MNRQIEIGKLPPSDIESEDALLALLLAHPEHLHDIRSTIMDGEVFYRNNTQLICRAMISLLDEQKTVRPLTVIQYLTKMATPESEQAIGQLREIMSMPIVGMDIRQTVLTLREMHIRRLAIVSSGEILRAAYGSETFDQVMDLTRAIGEKVLTLTSMASSKGISHYAREALQHMIDASNQTSGLVGINTGLGKINRVTGGWRPQKFILVGGRPGSGKTGLLIYHLYQAAKSGIPVGFISAEMPYTEVVTRMVSMIVGINYEDLGKGCYDSIPNDRVSRQFTPEDWNKIQEATAHVESLPIYLYEGISYDIANVSAWIREVKRKHKVQLCGIDYVQLIENRLIKQGGDVARVSSVSRALKLLANTVMTLIALAQLSREVDTRPNKRPVLRDLRESGQLEADADMVIFLYREDYYRLNMAKEKGEMIDAGDMDFILEYDIAKYRGGRPRMARLYFHPGTNVFLDEPPADVFNPKPAPAPKPRVIPQDIGGPDPFGINSLQLPPEREETSAF